MEKINLQEADSCNESAIHDVLYVLRDKKMWINEKKFYITTIDLLDRLGYYRSRCNNGEKASLFGDIL